MKQPMEKELVVSKRQRKTIDAEEGRFRSGVLIEEESDDRERESAFRFHVN